MTLNKDLTIQKIEKEFEKLANLVLEQLDLLDELVKNKSEKHGIELITQLESNESKIDKHEVQLDDSIIKAIVLYQPMATDLRRLFAIYNMTTNLERVGDLVWKITLLYRDLQNTALLDDSKEALNHMHKITARMVNTALLSFINKDMTGATQTIDSDNNLDELFRKLIKKSLKFSGLPKSTRKTLNDMVDLRVILSSFERIGDHATNIAEASIYAISGSNIKHQEYKK